MGLLVDLLTNFCRLLLFLSTIPQSASAFQTQIQAAPQVFDSISSIGILARAALSNVYKYIQLYECISKHTIWFRVYKHTVHCVFVFFYCWRWRHHGRPPHTFDKHSVFHLSLCSVCLTLFLALCFSISFCRVASSPGFTWSV